MFWLALIVPAVSVLLLLLLPKAAIRWADIHAGYWIMLADFAVLAGSAVALRREILRWLKANLPPAGEILLALAVTGGALALLLSCVEPRHRVQSDESVFLAAAQNMYHNQTSATCDEGLFDAQGRLECLLDTPTFKGRGQSFVWMVLMPVLGTDLHWIFDGQAVLFVLTLLGMFLAVRLWTRDCFLALVTSAFFAFLPLVQFQFRSTSVEPLYVFLLSLSLIALHFVLTRDEHSPAEGDRTLLADVLPWILLGSLLGFFAQTRQETVFSLFAFVLAALPAAIARPRRWWSLVVSVTLFSLPILFTIAHYRGYNFQGGEFDAHGHFLENLKINWGVVTQEMSNDRLKNPFLSSHAWLFLGGLAAFAALCVRRPAFRKTALFLLLLNLQTYMILENVSGDFTIEINQRYAVVFYPVVAFLIALFLREALLWLFPAALRIPPEPAGTSSRKALAMAAIVAVFAGLLGVRHNESLKENVMYNRNHLTTEEREIHRWMAQNPLKDGERRLFVYNRPWHFVGYGISGVQYSRWRSWPQSRKDAMLEEYKGGVYFVRGLYCWENKTYHKKAVESRSARTCDDFERENAMREVFRTTITNNYPLVISKIADSRDAARIRAALPSGKIRDVRLSAENGELVYRASVLPLPAGSKLLLLAHPHGSEAPDVREIDLPAEAGEVSAKLPLRRGFNLVTSRVATPGEKIADLPAAVYANDGDAVPLGNLVPQEARQDWGSLQKDRTVNQNGLRVHGVSFADGWGTHANSHVEFDLGGAWSAFTGAVGLDDEEVGGDGVVFSVSADGREVWRSGDMRHGQIRLFEIPVKGVRRISLDVDGKGDIDYDHADWLNPRLFR